MRWFLIGTCLVLVAVTAAQWWLWPVQPPARQQTTAAGAGGQDVEPTLPNAIPRYQLPPLSEYREIDTRPLFVDGRKPPPPEDKPATGQDEAPTGEPLPTHLGLTAILQTPDGSLALIEDRKERQVLRMQQGADLAGWEIVTILPDRLVLSQGDKRQEMLLREFHAAPPPADRPAAGSRPPTAKKPENGRPKKGAPRKSRPRRTQASPR